VTRVVAWLVFCWMASSATAEAASRSVSHSDWLIARDQVTLRIAFPVGEAKYTQPPGQPPPTNEELAAYVLSHVAVKAQGLACEPIDQGYDIGHINTLAAGEGLYGFEIIFHCPGSFRPTLKNAFLFERMPQHVDYARIEVDGSSSTQVFTAARQQIDLADTPVAAGVGVYLGLGASHIAHDFERMCFFLGLMLLARKRREWCIAALGLTAGYVLSSLLPLTSLAPSTASFESALGLLVMLCAVQWISQRVIQSWRLALALATVMGLSSVAVWRLNTDAGWLLLGSASFSSCFALMAARRSDLFAWVLPLLFGALDGTVLWGDYSRLHLRRELSISTLSSFNAGSLLLELGIMAALCGAAIGWSRVRKSRAFEGIAAEAAVTGLAGLGAFWVLIQLKG
jgi:hypothetical protein